MKLGNEMTKKVLLLTPKKKLIQNKRKQTKTTTINITL
jgi:hypothetical protein